MIVFWIVWYAVFTILIWYPILVTFGKWNCIPSYLPICGLQFSSAVLARLTKLELNYLHLHHYNLGPYVLLFTFFNWLNFVHCYILSMEKYPEKPCSIKDSYWRICCIKRVVKQLMMLNNLWRHVLSCRDWRKMAFYARNRIKSCRIKRERVYRYLLWET